MKTAGYKNLLNLSNLYLRVNSSRVLRRVLTQTSPSWAHHRKASTNYITTFRSSQSYGNAPGASYYIYRLSPKFTNLIGIRNIDRLPALRHISDDARSPRYPDLLLLLHLDQRTLGADIEQLGYQTSTSWGLTGGCWCAAASFLSLDEEEGAPICMQKHGYVLEDLVAQGANFELVTDVLNLE